MSIEKWQSEVSKALKISLTETLPEHSFKEVIEYSVFPTGKLFRPLLCLSLAKDLGEVTNDHIIFSQALELHHTYSLVHDDLPSMDDDDYRRNRLSAHKKFSEWKAILSGDSLLNLSYELISKLEPRHIPQILKEFTYCNGPRGLILGQVMDLGNENSDLKKTLKLHELKTGRLIQLSLIGSAIISEKQDLLPELKDLGKAIGLNFQLLDDLCEFSENVNKHELEINPFVHFNRDEIFQIIINNSLEIKSTCLQHRLISLQTYIDSYTNKVKEKLKNGLVNINKHIELSLDDINKIQ